MCVGIHFVHLYYLYPSLRIKLITVYIFSIMTFSLSFRIYFIHCDKVDFYFEIHTFKHIQIRHTVHEHFYDITLICCYCHKRTHHHRYGTFALAGLLTLLSLSLDGLLQLLDLQPDLLQDPLRPADMRSTCETLELSGTMKARREIVTSR